ncbi:hypothetical protein AU468_10830 [Alkalispirochaeta sphaeroplastigenens]|uniref:Uncharacterized protein n=1 Tax=Alkalispirochaeta sphaeroplastigenens TaxID=1187066 RepID=A0A2S4JHT4_9SPIO|nr:DUF5312 family protein [Alkalispirochaeta sphaeroplastigenens]POQ99102.1 hypothetical protein AU468_10830 [Alkalispirochaeta sphaeroplastigenens]
MAKDGVQGRGTELSRDEAGKDAGAKGVLERILGIFLGFGDPERDRKRALKAIGKSLSKDRFKFYKPRGSQVEAPLARMLYDTYRAVYAVRKLVQPSDTSGALKLLVIESRMTDQQYELKEQMEERALRERAKTREVKDLAEEVRDTLINFVGAFDANRVKEINTTYNELRAFVQFCNFDYYFTLRKFDSAISEDSFTYKPKFDSIDAEYVVDDLRDFQEFLYGLPLETDWQRIFDLLSSYRGVEVVDRDAWQKVVKALRQVSESRILERIVQHAAEDPEWIAKPAVYNARIVEPYLNELKTNVEGILQKLVKERRNNRIEKLVHQVFGTTVVARTKNYTAKANVVFQKSDVEGFLHTDSLNYLKAYLLDYFKKDMREIVQDLLIVRGKWVTSVQAQQVSDAYHGVLAVSEQIIKLDDSLADEGELGQRLRRAAGRVVERDPGTQKQLKELVKTINQEAERLVAEAAQNLIVIGKNLKALVEDVERKEPAMIINWKELDAAIEEDLREQMSALYRQLYYLVQLLQVYTAKS